ncbi:hypothetical protein FOL47_008759 [Perkinsus chesapeaki]|uniref:Uncharacterized protein n=1 Tax=Perkinsus chesapeaki TaxID=330153 RepID=A0A7J6LBY5_PERCH|nr:hypothetical protein FOL47_008759 [Perkinsus chesapeaki]
MEEATPCDGSGDTSKGSVDAPQQRVQDKAYGIMLEARDKISTLEGETSTTGSSSGFRSTYLQVAKAHQELLHALHGSRPRSRPAGVQTADEEMCDNEVGEGGELLDLRDEREIIANSDELESPLANHREELSHCGEVQKADFIPAGSEGSAEMSVLTDTNDQRAIEGFVSEETAAELLADAMASIDRNPERREMLPETRVESAERRDMSGSSGSNAIINEDGKIVSGKVEVRAESFLNVVRVAYEGGVSSCAVGEPATVPIDQGNSPDQPIGGLERLKSYELMNGRAIEAPPSNDAELTMIYSEEDLLKGRADKGGKPAIDGESSETVESNSNYCRGRTREDLCESAELVRVEGKQTERVGEINGCQQGEQGSQVHAERRYTTEEVKGYDVLVCEAAVKNLLAECYGHATTSDATGGKGERMTSGANWTGAGERSLREMNDELNEDGMRKELGKRVAGRLMGAVPRRNAIVCSDEEKRKGRGNTEGTDVMERQSVDEDRLVGENGVVKQSGRADKSIEMGRPGEVYAAESELPTVEEKLQTDEGELQTNEGELQTNEGELQTNEGELQTNEGELQTNEGELQTDEGELQTIEELHSVDNELPEGKGDGEPTSQGSSDRPSPARKARLVTPELAIFDTFARLVRQAKAYRKPRQESDDGIPAEDEKGWGDVRGRTDNYLPDMTPKEQKTVKVAVSKKRLMNADGRRRKIFDADPF